MTHLRLDAPHPELRIIPTDSLHPHEEHDNQRSVPLAERLSRETHMINPPVVAPMEQGYVILDGANRFHAFTHLGYPHILVQIVEYESEWVELDTWHHVVSGWNVDAFLADIAMLADTMLIEAEPHTHHPLAHITTRDGAHYELTAVKVDRLLPLASVRNFVSVYQSQAHLHRTAIHDSDALWALYPDAIALVRFPSLTRADVLRAAQTRDFLPPGVSRHIVHGRAVRVNYPLDALRDSDHSLDEKNERLQAWIRARLASRAIRYYAESTYQFDE